MQLPMELPMIFALALSLAMAVVVISDTRHFIIPNSLNLFLLALYALAAYLLGFDWLLGVVAMAVVLIIGMLIFATGILGGGDIKLLIVLMLWIGWGGTTGNFLFLTAIFGGFLAMILLLARVTIGPVWRRLSPSRRAPRVLTPKQPLPYGVAIAAAFMLLLWTNQIPHLKPL